MIPRLDNDLSLDPIIQRYLTELKEQSFTGDIAASYADRIVYSTDNSVYQLIPQAILFPKSVADVVRITKLAQKVRFKSLKFTPRGGGTGTNGQSLNQTIIVDLSKYMNQIVELNVEERWVRVQAGVVKDQLNQYLKPYGLFFSPELSTSNRATLGGMINTDASGQGSLVYGKTSDHVLALRSVLINGEILDSEALSCKSEHYLLEQLIAKNHTENSQKIHSEIYNYCKNNRSFIVENLPQLNRFLTGYDLKNVFNRDLSEFNLTRLLTGSEGSLAFICEAKLNLLPIPKHRVLINIKYNSFDAALRNAPFMLQAKALSVETIDSKVLNLAKQDIIWHSVKNLLQETEAQPILGLNIVEYAGHNLSLIQQQVDQLCQALDHKMATAQDGIIGYQVCDDLNSIERIYSMRKKAVGLLGNAQGWAKPIPFVEDTCVPPEHLADYIAEFRALLDSHGLNYGMFGHVDAGVLHVRPALDLCDKEQVQLLKTISDQVVALTYKYSGLIWGEHGKGMRSEYAEKFFGDALWQQLRYIKTLFDPDNRLNPGKICTPLDCSDRLYPVLSPLRADYDRQIPLKIREEFAGAMNCNGNGLCFNFDVDTPLCPSMKVSHNRLFSPKGRASLVREWLRLLAQQQIDLNELTQQSKPTLRNLLQKCKNSWFDKKEDFSNEVKDAMDTCLACKACASQCPIKIDVPTFRSKFLQAYHSRYFRPLKDHLVANVEWYAPLMAKQPKFFNFFLQHPLSERIACRAIGMVDLPLLSTPSLQQQLVEIGYQDRPLETLQQLSAVEKEKFLFIVQDPFTSFYEAKVVADFVQLTQKLGFSPIVLPFNPNGKAQHVKGFLQRFAKTATKQADILTEIARLNIPLVGVDPAIVLTYRQEYRQLLPQLDFNVLTANEWLIQVLDKITTKNSPTKERTWYLLPHCTESTSMPNSMQQWQQIFAHFGETLKWESSGCCGMAGTFGHESKHLNMSKEIYQLSWGKKLADKTKEHCLATGYSCRSQVKRMENYQVQHPVQALLSLL